VAPFKKTAGKLQGLWNCQNRRTVAANQIKEAIGKKLKTPGVTRWNSYYDACAMLLEVLEDPERREKLNVVLRKQSLPIFYDADKALLAQYCKIMKPVATCLDILQAEEKAYMGIFLPTIKLMKDQVAVLRTDNSIEEGQELISYLLENPTKPNVAFKGRFQHLFEDKDLLMATALHPHFKLGVVGYMNIQKKEDIKRAIVNEALMKVRPLEEIGGGEMQQGVEDDPFRYMRDEEVVATQGRLEEDMEKTYDGWNRLRVNSSTRVTSDQFPLLHRNVWLELFIKYNTPLPSSAAVERLFSIGSDILRPKRSTLTADNFEKLVFIKGNLQLLDETSILASLDMGDETPDADE
jgi:hypothetical protein